jgi:hypothetical protein
MTWLSFDRYASPRHTAAALVAVIALAVGVVLIATTSGGATHAAREHPAPTASPAPAATHTQTNDFPHTQAGAVAAATAWCQNTGEAFLEGTWNSAVARLATPAFRARAERQVDPAAALVHRRLAAAHVPYAARLWPLGYAVQQYSPASARVRVWQLLTLGISGPLDQTTFYTTTVSLLWSDGTWKVTATPPGPDLPPPSDNATTHQVAAWVTAVDQFREYRYAP